MIRSVPSNAGFTMGRLGSAVSMVTTFNPITAGIGAGVSLATTGLEIWAQHNAQKNAGKSATTAIVNGLAEQLQHLKDAYLSERNPSCADQRAALNAYDDAWQWLESPEGCGRAEFGGAGDNCIADRAPNGKFPWQSYYRDPIANDPRMANLSCDTGMQVVLPSLQTGQYTGTGITSTGGSAATGLTPAQIAAAALEASGRPAPAASPATAGTNYLPILIGMGAAVLIAKAL